MKIGIFGGSFNPPHQMHLEIGEKMISHGYVDQVIYVPTGKKYPKSDLLEDDLRYQMALLMTEDKENLQVSDYGLQNHRVYTYQTLAYFKNQYSLDEICFILGSDLYLDLPNWKHYEEILRDYHLLVILRNSDKVGDLESLYQNLPKKVTFTDVHPFVLSSTELRKALKEKNLDFVGQYISKKVFDFIIEKDLYQSRM